MFSQDSGWRQSWKKTVGKPRLIRRVLGYRCRSWRVTGLTHCSDARLIYSWRMRVGARVIPAHSQISGWEEGTADSLLGVGFDQVTLPSLWQRRRQWVCATSKNCAVEKQSRLEKCLCVLTHLVSPFPHGLCHMSIGWIYPSLWNRIDKIFSFYKI